MTSWREFLKRLAVAEERGHRNQEIAEQRLRLFGVVAQDLVIVVQVVGSRHLHAARDAAQDRRALVFGEIVAGAHTQMRQHAPQQFFVHLTGIGPP